VKRPLQLLIVGVGSAGRRHARNFRTLGCAVSAVDPREDRLKECATEGPLVGSYLSLESALAGGKYDGFVVASPPYLHVAQMAAILDAVPQARILTEKPLSVSAQEARRLAAHQGQIMVGYTYRWWPPLREMRARLLNGAIGAIRTMRFVMSAHLADWHPWEPYTDFFMARRAHGGGALLDESHFIDLMCWFLGPPESVVAQVDQVSSLIIDADDCVDILVRYSHGIRVNLHLDLIGRPHERSIRAMGENGSLVYEYESNTLRQGHGSAGPWIEQFFDCERNEMFMGVARDYLQWLAQDDAVPGCSWEDGLRALEIVDACRVSSERGTRITLWTEYSRKSVPT
jgi:predicted dehydrogenase